MSQRQAWQVNDSAAEIYEKSFVPALFAPAAAILADVAGIGPGDRVLDVACGTGALAREAVRRAGPTGKVVGLDLNPGMLEVARRTAPRIDWRQGDACSLPFPDGSFDRVLSQYALMFFPDREGALRHMWRVLAPSGRLAVSVCGPLAETPGFCALAEVGAAACTPAVAELLRSPFVLGDAGALAALARSAGIERARVETHRQTVRYPSIEALVTTEVRASPIRGIIDDAGFAALLEGAERRLAPLAGPDGTVEFPMPMHVIVAMKG